jgi:phospholipid/cholesterol/gamma-HCH transport system permease protein
VRGDWTLDNYATMGQWIALFRTGTGSAAAGAQGSHVDLSGLGALDTAGASRLFELLGTELAAKISGPDSALPPERNALLQTVAAAMGATGEAGHAPRRSAGIELLGRIGRTMEIFWRHILALLGFTGLTLEALAHGFVRPRR